MKLLWSSLKRNCHNALHAGLSCQPARSNTGKILRKSLDARSRHNLKFVYTIVLSLQDPEQYLKRFANDSNVTQFQESQFDNPRSGTEPLQERPVIVGSGPAGLLAGYYLAWKGYRPIILERGQPVKERVAVNRDFDRGGQIDHENNYLFGEGGAGCFFSDGKLTLSHEWSRR